MNVARIGLEFLSTLGAPIRSGRSFHSGDIGGSSGSAGSTDAAALPNSGRPTIVVNDSSRKSRAWRAERCRPPTTPPEPATRRVRGTRLWASCLTWA